ncbi:hypothetical protein FOA52_002801 [Chlamydomonas sp. UWO 241]|nr:hypothetical protein FOA52_002801 [Chlamydomonas sp. UWO 241]
MAPEILLDGRVSKAADVYAFGITLWELFTGGRPFQTLRVDEPGPPEEVPVVVPSPPIHPAECPSQPMLITSSTSDSGDDTSEARAANNAFLDGVAGDGGTRPWELHGHGARKGGGARGSGGAHGGGVILLSPTSNGSSNSWLPLMPPALLPVDEACETEDEAEEHQPVASPAGAEPGSPGVTGSRMMH